MSDGHDWLPPEVNTGVAHSARVYDYWLGGKDNFAADRALGDAMIEAIPSLPVMARANRDFLGRAVRYLAGEAGVTQFLDIGTGIPAAGNTHELAQAASPASRVVYVDNDPIVLAHARALMASHPAGKTAFIMADIRDPEKLLDDPAVRETLDLGQPVALMLVAIMMLFGDEENPQSWVRTLVDALPPGSYVAISHPTGDFNPGEMANAVTAAQHAGINLVPRGEAGVAAFLDGLELVDPGVVPVLAWRPDGAAPQDPRSAYYYAAIGRKP
jgi:S-adenosyl methyltransferase